MNAKLREVFALLSAAHKRRLYGLAALMAVSGLVEAIGVASILPFVALLGAPDAIDQNAYLAAVDAALGFERREDFLLFLGGVMGALVLATLALKLLTIWRVNAFVQQVNYDLSSRLFQHYLGQPYGFFLQRHSADLSKTVLQEVNQLSNGAILPVLNIFVNGALAFFMVLLIVVIEPVVGVTTLLVLGASYVAIYRGLRGWLARLGERRLAAVGRRFRIAQETFAGAKDVKVLGVEDACVRLFKPQAAILAETNTTRKVLAVAPTFAMQAIVFFVMLSVLGFLLATRSTQLVDVLPTIVLFAIAGSRTQAALNIVYQAMASIKLGRAAVDLVLSDIRASSAGADDAFIELDRADAAGDAAPQRGGALAVGVSLEAVSFRFERADAAAIEDVSLEIAANETVAFVGPTGAGKTTTVDLILGLLAPTRGRVLIDGAPLDDASRASWLRRTGYVSQSVFLKDDTVAANIAFGADPSAIDMEAVERAARMANIHDFILSELAEGYRTMVGDRGVRLSGGQRQRIAIARALYHDPAVLVLDEATSALDNQTERAVMDAVGALARKKTVIIVAHRLSTIRNADRIFYMESGRLVASGSFDDLLETAPAFRAMAGGVETADETVPESPDARLASPTG